MVAGDAGVVGASDAGAAGGVEGADCWVKAG